jgi:hypothetical protein
MAKCYRQEHGWMHLFIVVTDRGCVQRTSRSVSDRRERCGWALPQPRSMGKRSATATIARGVRDVGAAVSDEACKNDSLAIF